MKKNFERNGQEYEAFWNEKEYGANKTCYISATKSTGNQYKGSYSKAKQEFVDYRAGELDVIRAAAEALGL